MIGAKRASSFLSWVLDALAIGAVLATGEIHFAVLAIVVFVFGIYFFRRTVNAASLSWAFVGLLLGIVLLTTVVGSWFVKSPPVLLAAHGVPIFHAILWLLPRHRRSFSLRLGIGFMELNVAATLTPDLALAFLIFAFAVVASLAISCEYLANTRRTNEEIFLPRGFIVSSLVLSGLVLLSAAMIFPVLPRAKGQFGLDSSRARVGYTEQVSLSDLKSLTGMGKGEVVMRFFFSEEHGESPKEFLSMLYLGLLRGKVLSIFDGKNWLASEHGSWVPRNDDRQGKSWKIEAIREPLNTEILFAPYGTQKILPVEGSGFFFPIRSKGGEWVDPSIRGSRVRYNLVIGSPGPTTTPYGSFAADLPRQFHTHIPSKVDTPSLRRLAVQLFAGVSSNLEKSRKVEAFFKRQRFLASVGEGGSEFDHVHQADSLTPLEKFLFVDRSGHCELFSTSAAILLRMGGVPTRLITGFRVSRLQGSTMIIRSGDAHAWLEYWIPELGWRVFDPTPQVQHAGSFLERFRDAYDDLSGFWYRYVYSYSRGGQFSWNRENSNGPKDQDRLAGGVMRQKGTLIIAAITLLLLAVYFWQRKRSFRVGLFDRRRGLEGPRWLSAERKKMEKLFRRRLRKKTVDILALDLSEKHFGESTEHAFKKWKRDYLEARFGTSSDRDTWEERLEQGRRDLKRVLR